jgi:hypothetical protein
MKYLINKNRFFFNMLIEYSSKDFKKIDKNTNFYNFDQIIIKKSHNAMERGAFNYKFDDNIKTRILPGKYSFRIDLNLKRFVKKRKSQIESKTESETITTNIPFNSKNFNFNKIKEEEILLKLVNKDRKEDENLIIINNSPLGLAHSLLLHSPKKCYNQVKPLYY